MESNEKRLFLLDAFALIYRSYFAFSRNPRINSKGQNTSAVFGFTNTLIDLLLNEDPTHIAVVFDAPGPTFRSDDFSEYKANRDEMPEGIRWAIPVIFELLEAFDIPTIKLEGYEADDLIGTLAKKAEKKGYSTYMMTPDKDFGQLVSDKIFMYKPGRSGKPAEIWGPKEVKDKFEVSDPIQVIDILGLWGDAVDNIPGIPGIGEKTAKKLIQTYGSVENLIVHADELKGKQKYNVIEFAEQGLLSKKLATIIVDAPIELHEEELVRSKPNREKLIQLFSDLEFRGTIDRLFGKEATAVNQQLGLFSSTYTTALVSSFESFETDPIHYKLVQTKGALKTLLKELDTVESFCFDTETTGLDPISDEVIGIAFSTKEKSGWYVALSEENKADLLADLKPFLEHPTKLKIAQNLKFDRSMLLKYGVKVTRPWFDTMVVHYLLEPEMNHSMDRLAEKYLNYKPIPIESLLGKKGKNQKTMDQLEPEEVKDYAAEDADITFRLFQVLRKDLEKLPQLKSLYENVEAPLIEVLCDMEMAGIRIDQEALRVFSEELTQDLKRITQEIYSLAGVEFNIDSPKQLGPILFEQLKISSNPRKTKTGQYSTGEDVLSKLINAHPIVPELLEYRQVKKLKSTYVDALPKLVHPKDHRIHTTFMQTVAATGRLSSNNPNLQNIPIRTERGREIRRSFIPGKKGYVLLAADYSQIELRIMASLSNDPAMTEAFTRGDDIHAATAARVFKVPIDQVDREKRSQAKAVNFGIIYGQSAFGLSQNLNISRTEAKALIDQYFDQYPGIKQYMDQSIEEARKKGFVETIMGRRRYLPDINSANAVVRGFAERNAINAPIQGSAADIIKSAMIPIHQDLLESDSRMLLQVHDELVFEVPERELESVQRMVVDHMEHAFKLNVPLVVDANAAPNWLEAH
jgi:DNA polymerase-1